MFRVHRLVPVSHVFPYCILYIPSKDPLNENIRLLNLLQSDLRNYCSRSGPCLLSRRYLFSLLQTPSSSNKHQLWFSGKELYPELRNLHFTISTVEVQLSNMDVDQGKNRRALGGHFRMYCHGACITRTDIAHAGTCFIYPFVTHCAVNFSAWQVLIGRVNRSVHVSASVRSRSKSTRRLIQERG